jgi:hypothetical protein
MKSSENRGHQILGILSKKRAAAFLTDCANLRPTPESDKDAGFRPPGWWTRHAGIVPCPLLSTDRMALSAALGFLSLLLQKGWDAPTLRERVWFFREAESFSRRLGAKDAELGLWGTSYEQLEAPEYVFGVRFRFINPPAQPTRLEAAFYYLGQHMEHARHCANPECAAPYFFATKKNQKYCSSECAEPARRASKLRWWNDNRAGTPTTPKQSSGSKRKVKGESRAKAKKA